jgi:hypothetical protein
MRSIQRDLEKLSTDFPLLVGETTRPFRWSFQRDATMDIIPALDLPAALTFELARVINRGLGDQRSAINSNGSMARKTCREDRGFHGNPTC